MAAKWLGVAPWDLLEQPLFWLEWVQVVAGAENGAEFERQKRQERMAKLQRMKGGR